jgi:multifunctional methyltransferase subunit TRM112
MVEKVLQKTQLAALRSAAANLGVASKLLAGEEAPSLESLLGDEEALLELHHLLFELHVTEGFLVCPESGRRFPVKEGIPNMLLHEDEV